MSIYPVRLLEWFPPGDEMFNIAFSSVESTRCFACGSLPNYKKAVGHHSIPWGNGDIWCSWRCCRSGKSFSPDKRQRRKYKRWLKQNNYFRIT
jgi:hypothetical protein